MAYYTASIYVVFNWDPYYSTHIIIKPFTKCVANQRVSVFCTEDNVVDQFRKCAHITDAFCRRFTAQVFLHILPQVYTCGYMLRPLSRPVWVLRIPWLVNRFMLINHRFTPFALNCIVDSIQNFTF